jgi:hypothetical protein
VFVPSSHVFHQVPALTYVVSNILGGFILVTEHAQGTPTLPYMNTFVFSFAPSVLPTRCRSSWFAVEVHVLDVDTQSLTVGLSWNESR